MKNPSFTKGTSLKLLKLMSNTLHQSTHLEDRVFVGFFEPEKLKKCKLHTQNEYLNMTHDCDFKYKYSSLRSHELRL